MKAGRQRHSIDLMGYFYFDESVHRKANFALGAFAYSEVALEDYVAEALRQSGLKPKLEEFKSGSKMCDNPQLVKARELLKGLMHDHCRIGLVIIPETCRRTLGNFALQGLSKILTTNHFKSERHEVFFDQGVFPSVESGKLATSQFFPRKDCAFHFEEDSVSRMGLQVADLIAHDCATMLLAQLNLFKKMVKAGENSGYDPDSDMELEFVWTAVRYSFFAAAPPPVDTWASQRDFQVDVESRGLYIAESCDTRLREAAVARFGRMYLGCIH